MRMLRIPYTDQTKDQPRKPLLLMHPFFESSHAYIVQGPGKALGEFEIPYVPNLVEIFTFNDVTKFTADIFSIFIS